MSKVRLKLKCGKNEALDFIAAAEADGIEKARCDDEGVEIRLTKEEGGVRVVEYVFRGEVSDDEISGTFVRPDPRREDIPGPLKSALIVTLCIIIFAALFAAVYLGVLLFAHSPALALYIALPVFATIIAAGTVIGIITGNERRQLGRLKAFLLPVAGGDNKTKR